jgi:hypothetical protein
MTLPSNPWWSALMAGLLLLGSALAPRAAAAPSAADMVGMLKVVDDRQANNGDYTARVFIERKERDKSDLVYEAVIYRRDVSDKLAILFTKPAAEAGKGYLRVDNNLFFYDPTVGKWERRTERERIGGTNGQRQDFDQSRLHEEYAPSFVDEGKLGRFATHHLKLAAKDGVDVAYPIVELWLDQETGNVLKRQDFALSSRLMRTTYYPTWQKKFSESKAEDVYFAKEVRIFDEIEKGDSTTILITEVNLSAVDDSIFTKAWLEARSR